LSFVSGDVGLAVEDAVRAAAGISSIEVVAADKDPSSEVIPAESLITRLHSNGHRSTAWQPVPELAELADGEVGGFRASGATALVCRVGGDVGGRDGGGIYAYRDRCSSCTGTLAGAQLTGAVLRCPNCGASFDVVTRGGVGGDQSPGSDTCAGA
jgi:nitrite reductase/ring-hydroxylating ferredoxin subunit